MTSTATCPICTSGTAEEFLRRDRVAVHQNLVVNTAAAARDLGVGSLSMCACGNCGFVFNADFDAGLLDYGQRYDNTQTLSPTFAAHVDDRVRHLVESCGVRGATIVEVGCGKGDFLKRLVQADGGNSGWGFDPTYDGPDSLFDGRVRFRREFYDERQSPIRADIVICRHVIEHIQQPLALLQKVRRALADTPQARVFFETPCVEWILDQQVTWDFFYEHCSLFSRSSLTRAFVLSGFQVENASNVFEGQYLWLEAVASEQSSGLTPSAAEQAIIEKARQFRDVEHERNRQWRSMVDQHRRIGGVAVWGAGAKGVTFAGLVDPQESQVDCVVDINPRKQGRFLPGTGHPIVPPAALRELGVKTVLVLNPNYVPEIRLLLDELNLDVVVIDVMREAVGLSASETLAQRR